MPFDTYLFDLDGTLIDSIPDLTRSVNQLRAELDLAPVSQAEVRTCVGDGVGLLVQRALPEGLYADELRYRFMAIYTEHLTDETYLYPGISDFLETHSDHPMVVVTNKPQDLADRIIERFDLRRYFHAVVGADKDCRKKPHPDMVVKALAILGCAPSRSLLFGDHHVDLRAARTAGVSTCFCEWGYGHDDGLTPDYRAETTARLLQLFPGDRP